MGSKDKPGLTFEAALNYMQGNTKVARALWPEGHFIKRLESGTVLYCNKLGLVLGVWVFSREDWAATDWKIIP